MVIGPAYYYYRMMSMPVCLSVCLSARVSGSPSENIFRTTLSIFTRYLCVLPIVVARFSSCGVAIRFVLPVLCMTSCIKGPFTHTLRVVRSASKNTRSVFTSTALLMSISIRCPIAAAKYPD